MHILECILSNSITTRVFAWWFLLFPSVRWFWPKTFLLFFYLRKPYPEKKTKKRSESFCFALLLNELLWFLHSGRRCRDHIEIGFKTTCAISAYHYLRCETESRSGEVYSVKPCVKRFVGDLWNVGGILQCPPHQWHWPLRYNWNIVESGVKRYNRTVICLGQKKTHPFFKQNQGNHCFLSY